MVPRVVSTAMPVTPWLPTTGVPDQPYKEGVKPKLACHGDNWQRQYDDSHNHEIWCCYNTGWFEYGRGLGCWHWPWTDPDKVIASEQAKGTYLHSYETRDGAGNRATVSVLTTGRAMRFYSSYYTCTDDNYEADMRKVQPTVAKILRV
jgi:hypothetical protein